MKFALATFGSRGDVEPCVAIGRELLRRGHDVRMAVPPDLVGFAESVGLAAVAFGPEVRPILDAHRTFWTDFFRNFWKVRHLIELRHEIADPVIHRWDQICASLKSLADGADLLVSGLNFEQAAANVAEYHNIPLATVHIFPVRASGQFLSFLPAPVGRSTMRVYESVAWRAAKKLEDAQRSALGLPKANGPLPRRIAERDWVEIQAYEEVCFPGLAAEWAGSNGQRPFVGALTMELTTDADEEVASWIAAGTPPIFFGFGSTPVKSPSDTLAMIGAACAQLGERAVVCSGWSDFSDLPHFDHVKVVDAVNYAAVFPACRAVVHHGGMGTIAAGLRAGVPMLVLWTAPDQALWAAQVKRLKVGFGRRFSSVSRESLVADLRTILDHEYVSRARGVATRTTKPTESVAHTADLLENFARPRQVG
ncbi:glycosyltransferase [Mycobacterium sp. E2479]|uniref:glycosyltransferase n=1 Tax=Mycobacterium sp. E2479 TaxID=1834134 RepID=UPI0007FC3B98|nr:glycosyltransferase [Mycobacterium sp. E2479]OBH57183.1 glycosyl transferase family 1 [Mycobacterium sp. E2479]